MDIIKKISEELEVKVAQVQAAVDLLDEGCTVPFIARYRKEKTGALNDEDRPAPDGFLRSDHDLSVSEMFYLDFSETESQILGNSRCQVCTGSKSEDDRFLNHVSLPLLSPCV